MKNSKALNRPNTGKNARNKTKRNAHYEDGIYSVINIIQHYNLSFPLGNVLKYIVRQGKKENNTRLSDLEKARDYINYEIEWEKLQIKK